MIEIKGDLIELAKQGEFNIIVHGCNCLNIMGGGIARIIKEQFPEAFEADRECELFTHERLGNISIGFNDLYNLTIVNAYTQYRPAANSLEVAVDYDAVRSCMKKIKQQFSGKKIGMPKIGCGLANGSWQIVSKIISEELDGEDITIVYL